MRVCSCFLNNDNGDAPIYGFYGKFLPKLPYKVTNALCFQNVESSRSYIDDLYSSDDEKCLSSIICIKNSVIGSNRQKESVIAQGIVPRLMQLLHNKTMRDDVRLEAIVTIGSLAKGTEEHIELLINCGTVNYLLDILDESDQNLIDACLCGLRTLSQQVHRPINTAFSAEQLQRLLALAGPKESLLRQSCVASILSSACKGVAEQNALCAVGAPQVLASLLVVPNSAVLIPVLTCIATMCYENKTVATEIYNTCCNDVKVPSILVMLVCRDKPVEMQLEAARCLANMYRAGALSSKDYVIIYKALPCLVRLCQVIYDMNQSKGLSFILAFNEKGLWIASISVKKC